MLRLAGVSLLLALVLISDSAGRVNPSPDSPVPSPPIQRGRNWDSATGHLRVVSGTSRPAGKGPVRRFMVEVQAGLGIDRSAFAAAVERILADPRGWTSTNAIALRRVARDPVAFRVTLASPKRTDELCAPMATLGRYSCFNEGRAVINAGRWLSGAHTYGRLSRYRAYLINHEVGHALGLPHLACHAVNRRAPVMLQQTIGLSGCRANPWPTKSERALLGG
jgi:hypothetical protein